MAPRPTSPPAAYPASVAIGDLNADGNPDLATANSGADPDTVSVLLGNGTGGFGANTDFATGKAPSSVAIGDLDADDNPDLATANLYGADSVSVLLGDGTGGFGANTDFATGSDPASVAIGDLDADGNAGPRDRELRRGQRVGAAGQRDGRLRRQDRLRRGQLPRPRSRSVI